MSDPTYRSDQAAAKQFASRAQLLGLSARRYGETTLPRSGLTVRFQSLADGEFSDFQDAAYLTDEETGKVTVDKAVQKTARARLIALTAVDAEGDRLFDERDVPAIAGWDTDDLLTLYDAIREHVGLAQMIDRAKQREALKKN